MTQIALIGNPNSGKTTLFNDLTGTRQRVGNWPGVTVERKTGSFRHGDSVVQVVDLPGTYFLETVGEAIDEQIARNFIVEQASDITIRPVVETNLVYFNLEGAEFYDTVSNTPARSRCPPCRN